MANLQIQETRWRFLAQLHLFLRDMEKEKSLKKVKAPATLVVRRALLSDQRVSACGLHQGNLQISPILDFSNVIGLEWIKFWSEWNESFCVVVMFKNISADLQTLLSQCLWDEVLLGQYASHDCYFTVWLLCQIYFKVWCCSCIQFSLYIHGADPLPWKPPFFWYSPEQTYWL